VNVLELIVEALSWILIVGGGCFALIGALGLVRFPDFWTRLHAASVTDSAGVILMILGMCLQSGWSLVTVKLLIIGAFLFVTGPTATHAVANAALATGLRPREAAGLRGAVPDEELPPLTEGTKP
jgi:multicomponent Na+:H+ antiporter subunit G